MSADIPLKIVRDPDRADFNAIRVTIFRATNGRICGWLLGPSDLVADGEGYIPPSTEAFACIAVLRALSMAETLGCEVSVIDPDDLWPAAWG